MAAERVTTQLWLLSPWTVQRRGKAGARNEQFTCNDLPTLPAIGKTEAGRVLLEDRARRSWQESRAIRSCLTAWKSHRDTQASRRRQLKRHGSRPAEGIYSPRRATSEPQTKGGRGRSHARAHYVTQNRPALGKIYE